MMTALKNEMFGHKKKYVKYLEHTNFQTVIEQSFQNTPFQSNTLCRIVIHGNSFVPLYLYVPFFFIHSLEKTHFFCFISISQENVNA